MKNFKIIYLILKALEKGMDNVSVDEDIISPESFGISEERFNKILLALEDEGYIAGLVKINTIGMRGIRYEDMRITIKGLEYLENNAMMNKAFRAIKGIREII